MATHDELFLDPEQDRPLPRLRRELEVSEQIYDGQPYWVIKDPIALRYYRFNREEYFIIDQLRRGLTLDELKEAHRREFQDDSLNNQELASFLAALLGRNLVIMPHANRDEILYRGAQKRRRTKWIGQLTNFMFFRIPLYDPDRLFDRLLPYVRFFWTKTFLVLYLILTAAAVRLLIGRWEEVETTFYRHFFTLRNIPILFVVVYGIKALHEFGHGLTCKNYGGEVHEMGFLFLVFTPFLYCNVTDSWTFADKSRRLLVTAGGIMTEILFASLAALAWHFSDPQTFFHSLMFNVMMVCSISTILFNANPLLKYDGYYLMMDLIEVPNLRQRSSKYVQNLMIRHLLGGRMPEAPEEHRFRFIFPLYSLAAYVYRWVIIIIIMIVVYHLLKQLHLAWLGALLVTVSMVTMLLLPVGKTARLVATRRGELGISNLRLAGLLALIGVLAAAGLFWPLDQHVTLNFLLEPAQVHWLRSEAAGRLRWDGQVREGAWIGRDDPNGTVAYLSNLELEQEDHRLEADLEQVNIQIAQAKNMGLHSSRIEPLQDRLNTLLRDQQRLREEMANLQVEAPFAAQVLTTDRERLKLLGKYVGRGEPLLLLADTRSLTAKVWVPEKTWARIFSRDDQRDQRAELMLYAFSDRTITGRVCAVSRHPEQDMGQFGEKMALSSKVGGEVPTERDPATDTERPIEAVYEVTVCLDAETLPESAKPYMSGRVRIDCGRYTLYQWGRDSLLRFISPDVRL